LTTDWRSLSGCDDLPTVCKNLLIIGQVTSEFKKGVCEIFAATRPQFDDRRLFVTLAFRNGFEHRNFNCSMLISYDYRT